MKNPRRFGAVAAFAIGAAVGLVTYGTAGNLPALVNTALFVLCPGFLVAVQVIGLFGVGVMTPGSFSSFLVATGLFNGLIYGLAWHLSRLAREGRRRLLVPVVLGAGLWVWWLGYRIVESWPRPEPPPAPMDLASPLAGRWSGVIHGARGDAPVTLILHPRTDGTLDGFEYTGRVYVIRFDQGIHAGDSLRYDVGVDQRRGRRDGTTMTIEATVGRIQRTWGLRFVSADTGRADLKDRVELP